FPRPMIAEGFEFSFSGLKTAVLHAVRASTDLERDRAHLARGFQDAVLDVLVTKLERAVRATGYSTAVLGGGVACSKALSARAAERLKGIARVAGAGTGRGLRRRHHHRGGHRWLDRRQAVVRVPHSRLGHAVSPRRVRLVRRLPRRDGRHSPQRVAPARPGPIHGGNLWRTARPR